MIVEIKNNNFSAKIDTFGAQLISFKCKDATEYIWQRKSPYWKMCAPILFPVVGRSLNGVITVDGKDYPMPLHGFAADREFEIINQSDSFVSMILKSSEETRKCYPFNFELVVSFGLDFTGIKTEMNVKNTDKKIIFFGIGGHPGINWPIYDEDDPEDYFVDFGQFDELKAITCDEKFLIIPESEHTIKLENGKLFLKRELFESDAIIIDNVSFSDVKFVNRKGKGINFIFDNFKSFAIWTESFPSKAPFICLEPWNSMGKRSGEGTKLNDKKDIINLGVDEEFVCSYSICPIE